jgi:hypothetical protein
MPQVERLKTAFTSAIGVPPQSDFDAVAYGKTPGWNSVAPGGGFFFGLYPEELAGLEPNLARRDQTLTSFGFEDEELRSLIQRLNERAIDRFVPI